MSDPSFPDVSVEAFVQQLGSGESTPGGGAAAAVTGALGAALVRMHAEVTRGSADHVEHGKLMQAIAEQAGEEAATLLALAKEDEHAYAGVLAAAEGDDLQAAYVAACEVPLRIMERCLEIIAMAKTVVQHGVPSAAADGATAAELARSAMRTAGYCVKANLMSIDSAEYRESARGRLDEIEYMGISAAGEVDSRANDLWVQGS